MSTREELLQIGDAAESVGLSLRTVRYWEEMGLVQPEARSKGGFRLYSNADLHRLRVIKAMKPLGLTLDEMRQLLELLDDAAAAIDAEQQQAIRERGAPLAYRIENQVDRMERDLADARVLLLDLRQSLSGQASRTADSVRKSSSTLVVGQQGRAGGFGTP